jgi:hypothetical protein
LPEPRERPGKVVTAALAVPLLAVGYFFEIAGMLGCGENVRVGSAGARTCSAFAYSDAESFRWFVYGLFPALLFLLLALVLRPRRLHALAVASAGIWTLVGVVTIGIIESG